jgi:predicted  nucleic acid-binding Zn-ribbon protein
MKITDALSQQLLDLVRSDQKLKQLQLQVQGLISGESLANLKAEYANLSSELLLARNQYEAVESELKKAEIDLHTVEERIVRDQDRLKSTSSTKDIQGIESELATLAKRKSDLEDAELALLENLDDLKRLLDEAQLRHGTTATALKAAESNLEAEITSTRSELDQAAAARTQQHTALGAELGELYDKKAARGVAAGRLSGGECGACRMQLGAVDLDHITSTAHDELVFCPECQAILVRN